MEEGDLAKLVWAALMWERKFSLKTSVVEWNNNQAPWWENPVGKPSEEATRLFLRRALVLIITTY